MKCHIDAARLGIRSPHDVISIKWECYGASGSTECEAWRGQHEIESLERAGYSIKSIELHHGATA